MYWVLSKEATNLALCMATRNVREEGQEIHDGALNGLRVGIYGVNEVWPGWLCFKRNLGIRTLPFAISEDESCLFNQIKVF